MMKMFIQVDGINAYCLQLMRENEED